MSETRFHGARVTENTDLVTAINDVDSSVIGIVATADDADAKLFPLNKPTLLTRVNDVLGKCGTLAWILEKLGVLPDEAERARKKIEDAQRAAILQDKVALLQGDLAKINPPKPVENGNGTGGDKPKDNKPLTDSNTGTLRRLSKIADNTGKLVDETKKRIGPGDIVFKNLPRALAVRGEWQERKIAQVSKPAPAINITPVVPAPLPPALVPVVAASSRPVAEAIRSPVASAPTPSRNREPVASGFGGEIHVHLHNVVTQNPRELAKLVGEMVRAEMERRARAGRGSFYDKD